MLELTPDCFDSVCDDPAVREQLGMLETHRRDALQRFWLWAGGGLALGAAAVALILRAGGGGAAMLAVFIPMLAVFAGSRGLARVSGELKHPVLAALAAKAGLEYMADGFSPPVYPEGRKALFGRITTETFTDLFHGHDAQGLHYGLYEAKLVRGSGKNRHTVFEGQIYAVERRPAGGSGIVVVVPDRGLFNFLKPSGLERVRMDSDPAFDGKFEVYASDEMAARQLLFDSAFRGRLLALRALGRTFVFVGPDNAMVAASTRKNRFEPGSMFSARPAEERVKAMVGDVCDALATLRWVKERLG